MGKATDFRYNTGATRFPWAAVGENYNVQDLMEIVKFLMQGEGPEYEEAVKNVKAQIEKLELDWGYQESEDDYKFLIYMYEKYTKGVTIENPQQEDLYRDLCLARLEKRKAEQGKIDTDITKIQGRILTLMNKLKLDEFESTKPKTVSEQLIFAKIAQIEQTKPADLYKEPNKYKDYSKLRKYMKDLVLRPALNTLVGNKDFNLSLDDVESYNIEDE